MGVASHSPQKDPGEKPTRNTIHTPTGPRFARGIRRNAGLGTTKQNGRPIKAQPQRDRVVGTRPKPRFRMAGKRPEGSVHDKKSPDKPEDIRQKTRIVAINTGTLPCNKNITGQYTNRNIHVVVVTKTNVTPD